MKKNIYSDLLIILIWIVITFIFVIVPILSDSIIRTILVLPLILFIPGYLLIVALFPMKDDLENIERIALSFGLSIAVVPLLGLILNFSFGIRLIPILITLCLYSIILIFIANYRRKQLPEDSIFKVSLYKIYEIIKTVANLQNGSDKILTGILVLNIIMALGALVFVITIPKIGERFTEFYILGDNGKADNYSTNLKSDVSSNVIVGIVNHEYSSVNYKLQIDLDKDMLRSEEVILEHNETWERHVTFLPIKKGTNLKLEFILFKENNFSSPYRKLHLWVNVT